MRGNPKGVNEIGAACPWTLRGLTAGGLVALLMVSAVCRADLTTCNDLYVGRIWVQQGYGLRAVVFLNSPTDTSGSYWTYFDDFSTDDKKSALALLTSAKLAQHRVNVVTSDPNGCDISTTTALAHRSTWPRIREGRQSGN